MANVYETFNLVDAFPWMWFRYAYPNLISSLLIRNSLALSAITRSCFWTTNSATRRNRSWKTSKPGVSNYGIRVKTWSVTLNWKWKLVCVPAGSRRITNADSRSPRHTIWQMNRNWTCHIPRGKHREVNFTWQKILSILLICLVINHQAKFCAPAHTNTRAHKCTQLIVWDRRHPDKWLFL